MMRKDKPVFVSHDGHTGKLIADCLHVHAGTTWQTVSVMHIPIAAFNELPGDRRIADYGVTTMFYIGNVRVIVHLDENDIDQFVTGDA